MLNAQFMQCDSYLFPSHLSSCLPSFPTPLRTSPLLFVVPPSSSLLNLLQFLSKVQSFESFLSGNMHILSHKVSHEDIVQLALFQPDTSEVCQQAFGIARGDCDKRWMKWRWGMS